MEYFGVVAFIFWLFYADKHKKLQRRLNKLERRSKGENQVSQLIQKMINQVAKINFNSSFEAAYTWTILEADEDWVKLERTDKKGKVFTKIVRLDDIQSIDIEG
ncbi:hypothetical protein [Streptococcus porci]|uniref:hypothetical protein n=1 Tax=Streptococcus porci TaxID=502567 RepID=UPI0003F9CA94|nr:hypothetical protein [Streptococcus porci]